MRCEKKSAIDLYKQQNVVYEIPVYQRNYSWGKDQCEELIDDIIKAGKTGNAHFLNCFVRVRDEKSTDVDSYFIIDGQQRYTTMYILLKAISFAADIIDDYGIKKDTTNWLFNIGSNRQKLKLKPVKSDNECLEKLLFCSNMSEFMQRVSSANSREPLIFNNFLLIAKMISEKFENVDSESLNLLIRGIEKLEIVLIDLEKGDDPHVIFEKINSTGEELSISDLLRNYLLMTEHDSERLYEEYWLKIENRLRSALEKEHLNDFISAYIKFKVGGSGKSGARGFGTGKRLYYDFKAWRTIEGKGIAAEEILEELLRLSGYFAIFEGLCNEDTKGDVKWNCETDNVAVIFKFLKTTTIYPLLFHLYEDARHYNLISDSMLRSCLQFFANYIIRVLLVGNNTGLNKFFISLYDQVKGGYFRIENLDSDYLNAFYRFFSAEEVEKTSFSIPPINEICQHLLNEQLRNTLLAKMILFLVNMDGDDGIGVDVALWNSCQIHQLFSESTDEELLETFGVSSRVEADGIRRNLSSNIGNLTLAWNDIRKTKKLRFEEKKKVIASQGFEKLMFGLCDMDKFGEHEIKSRAVEMVRVLEERLRLPDVVEPVGTNAAKSSGFVYTLLDDVNLEWTAPRYFEYNSRTVFTNNWKEFLLRFCEEVIMKDRPQLLSDMADMSFGMPRGPVVLTRSKNTLRSPFEIAGTGIFIETNNSSSATVRICQHLMEKAGLNLSRFHYCIRYRR